ncbi:MULTISPECIES: hypothetical protein [Tenacibaculum]|uniref:Uncharacterized protein n=2 Tax=Tenacibaculum TaxID=104267 RepID=A0AAE9MKH2_9FLAO|nr:MULTISPECIES: hypothetical protein [Tenacibaculum]GFD81889.1 hypothetical protein KUL118_47510 [Tenacibaculum sp. KUL118]GFD93346.1 hypothetical protein KUL154_20790 [Alteromonas sp. KUL154]GFE00303.1 hypothetical protein KUL156_28950 [Alteromonas sp. KUL156]AZJ31327.1 hypothetical protein D6200_01575 [Tenacibaculum mesophilum]KAF9660383.1 hypothetical protein HBA12_09180 [Tenacibaculum mesophilum]
MASIKNLKKDINYTLGDIISICQITKELNPEADKAKADAIVDEVIVTFDDLVAKVNAKNVENKKAHYKSINTELETRANALIEKVNSL